VFRIRKQLHAVRVNLVLKPTAELLRPLPGSKSNWTKSLSGGIASLNPRLMAATPAGVETPVNPDYLLIPKLRLGTASAKLRFAGARRPFHIGRLAESL